MVQSPPQAESHELVMNSAFCGAVAGTAGGRLRLLGLAVNAYMKKMAAADARSEESLRVAESR